VIDVDRVPLAPGATVEDLGFGEDYELLAATPSPGRFAVVGRCEPGRGVEVLRSGRPISIGGWSHFEQKS
jgi:thiamine monophosphate kinase